MKRPNILLLTADDMNGDTPGCFGGHPEVTPTIDRLASEGTIFRKAHVAIAVCQPSRSAIMTGRWPHRNVAEGFGPVNEGVPLLTNLLKEAGYHTGILGKVTHLAPIERFRWDFIRDYQDLCCGRSPDLYGHAVREFITSCEGRPWFLMANSHDPHRPFHGSEQALERFDDKELAAIPEPSKVFSTSEVTVPGFLPDLPSVRQEIAEFHSSSRRCDDAVKEVLGALEECGEGKETLVVFLSDNGMSFPYAKANSYLHSTRTPLVVRWPGHIRAGHIDTSSFVSALDLFPTFCEIAGIEVPAGIDGLALTATLTGQAESARDHVVTVFHETAKRGRFEMRCIQRGDFGYIWNGWYDGQTCYGTADNMTGRTWSAMVEAAESNAAIKDRVDFYLRREIEELYDFSADPDALTNLATDPQHTNTIEALRSELDRWMESVDDPLRGRYLAEVLGVSGTPR